MATFPGAIFHKGGGAGVHHQRYTVGHADFTAAALTEAVSMTVTHPAGTLITTSSHKLGATFTGAGITAAVIDVGVNAGNLDRFVDAVDVFTATFPYAAAVGDGSAVAGEITTTTIDVTLTTVGANVVAADTGSYTFDLFFARVDVDHEPVNS
jgi:hypothetical protein